MRLRSWIPIGGLDRGEEPMYLRRERDQGSGGEVAGDRVRRDSGKLQHQSKAVSGGGQEMRRKQRGKYRRGNEGKGSERRGKPPFVLAKLLDI